jgi:PleD family two-component response regulator
VRQSVILASEHWRERPVVAVALWASLLILPLYYHRLLERLQDAKLALERKLNKTVHAATHDPLTDLANLGYFVQRLEEVIESGQRSGVGFALLYLDLDRFKPINDTLGRAAGDRVLVEVVGVLTRCARRSGPAARLALRLGPELLEVFEQRHPGLKLDTIHGHGTPP